MLFFYVLGDVLGSGIYALIGVMALEVGGAFWTSFVVGVTVAMLTGFAYAEPDHQVPQAAGAALYVSKAFGNRFFTCRHLLHAQCEHRAAGALPRLRRRLLQGVHRALTTLVAIGFIVVLALLNFRGISESVKANMLMSLVEITDLGIVLAVGAAVLFQGDADFSRPFEFKGDGNEMLLVLAGAALAFFSMTGFENAANVAEETKNPNKVFPRALLGGMAVAGVLYLLVAFIASMVAPTDQIAGSESALLEVVKPARSGPGQRVRRDRPGRGHQHRAGRAGGAVADHVRHGPRGRRAADLRPHARQPADPSWVAIVFTTAVVIALLVTADVERLAAVTVLFLIAVYALVCVSALRLRKDTVDHDHYRAPTWTLYAGLVTNLGLLAEHRARRPGRGRLRGDHGRGRAGALRREQPGHVEDGPSAGRALIAPSAIRSSIARISGSGSIPLCGWS